MKSKIISAPQCYDDGDNFEETIGAYELSGTLIVMTVVRFQGNHVAYTIRKGGMAALKKRTNYLRWKPTDLDLKASTELVFQDGISGFPSDLLPRIEIAFRERMVEVLTAAGVSNHARLRLEARIVSDHHGVISSKDHKSQIE